MNAQLQDLQVPLHEALERLVLKDERSLPFVVVEEVVLKTDGIPKAFVQWCTKDGKLLFDVPWAKIVGEPMEIYPSIHRAIELFRRARVCDDERLLIIEDEQRSGGDGERFGVIFPEAFVVRKA